ncbi:MAG: hypothetical protein WC242_00305 [Candidatus Paceibacterota bacterium]|jgi:hypothetical protein
METRNVRVLIFEKQGCVSGVFEIIPFVYDSSNTSDEDLKAFVRRQVIETIRSRGSDLSEKGELDKARFFRPAAVEKQKIYRQLPYKVGDSYVIIDAFVSRGFNFKLDCPCVFVEVCQSRINDNDFWVNIYDVDDAQVPICVILVEEYVFIGPISDVGDKEKVCAGA